MSIRTTWLRPEVATKHPQDDSWSGIKNLKNNITMMMMGSASELPPEPAEKTQFIEDMTESQVNQAVCLHLILFLTKLTVYVLSFDHQPPRHFVINDVSLLVIV